MKKFYEIKLRTGKTEFATCDRINWNHRIIWFSDTDEDTVDETVLVFYNIDDVAKVTYKGELE